MQQNAMRKSPLTNKASGLCYCCPGVTQATKMIRKGCLHEMENSVSTNNYIIIMPSQILKVYMHSSNLEMIRNLVTAYIGDKGYV